MNIRHGLPPASAPLLRFIKCIDRKCVGISSSNEESINALPSLSAVHLLFYRRRRRRSSPFPNHSCRHMVRPRPSPALSDRPTDRDAAAPPTIPLLFYFQRQRETERDRERQGERGRWHQNGYPARSTSCATGKMHTSRPSSGDDRAIRGNKRPDAIPSHPTVIGPRRRRLPCHSARVAANLAVHGALTMMWNARVSTKDKIKCNSLSF